MGLIHGIVGLVALFLLFCSIWMPPGIGRGGTPSEHGWQLLGVIAFIAGLITLVKRTEWSFLVLLFACAFFFVSCTANFHWKGG